MKSWLLRWRVSLAELRLGVVAGPLLGAGIAGFLGALAATGFRWLIDAITGALTGRSGDVVEAAAALDWWQRLLVPTAGGLAAGFVLHFGMRLARRESSTDYMEAVVLGDGAIPVRASAVKITSSLFTLASGGSIGREGPMAQLSTVLASVLGRQIGLSVPRLRLLVACGAAAGIASAYNAPIAGALFVAEVVLGSIAMESFGPLVFASVISTVTTRHFLGDNPLFPMGGFELVSYGELAAYLLLGLLAGVAAPLFLRFLWRVERAFAALPVPVFVKLALGGLVVGALSIHAPEVWGNGYSAIAGILRTAYVWDVVAVLLAFKLLATAATFGSGAVGGVFTPTLFVGAAVGYLFGTGVHAVWPADTAAPHDYALVGAACVLAGTTHAPLMAILMMFEMTLDYDIVLPLMLACVTAYQAARLIDERSVYAESLRRKRQAQAAPPVHALRVRDLMKGDPPTARATERFAEIAKRFSFQKFDHLWVVDADGHLLGAISLHEIKVHLGEADVVDVVIASDVMQTGVPTLAPDSPLPDALARFRDLGGEHLPVVEDGRVVATLAKTDLLLTLAHGLRDPAAQQG